MPTSLTPHNTLLIPFSPSTTSTLRAIYQDRKKPEHHVGFNLLRQEGQKREEGRAKRSETEWGRRRGDFEG